LVIAITLISGFTIGVIATIVNVTSLWMTDIKTGFCQAGWYLSKRICCINYENEESGTLKLINKGVCDEWTDWSFAVINISDVYLVKWLSYAGLSVFDQSVH
jgi:chloride channel 3/4/5